MESVMTLVFIVPMVGKPCKSIDNEGRWFGVAICLLCALFLALFEKRCL